MTLPAVDESGLGQVSRPANSALGRPEEPKTKGPSSRGGPARWWKEILLIGAFYCLYTIIRDVRGTRPVSVAQAFHNAERVIGLERSLGVFHEAQIQHWLLGHRLIIEFLDDWYGSTHFVVTAATLVVLFFVFPSRYRRWRNTLAAITGLALIGFAWFPLMPPRLLPPSYGFTDTLRVVGGLWNFSSGPMTHLSNQFAAMPSLHFAWALWCGICLFAAFRPWWAKVLALCYPVVTLACVIVTANHYFTDTAAGAITVLAGYGLARGVDSLRGRRPRLMARLVRG